MPRWDSDGAGVHDVIGSRCDPYTNWLMTGGGEAHTCCHSNLTRQALRDGLQESDVHDVLNVFMCTGFTKDTHQAGRSAFTVSCFCYSSTFVSS
jgi:hypothetical protein